MTYSTPNQFVSRLFILSILISCLASSPIFAQNQSLKDQMWEAYENSDGDLLKKLCKQNEKAQTNLETVYVLRSLYYLEYKKKKKVKKYLDSILKINPNNPIVLVELALIKSVPCFHSLNLKETHENLIKIKNILPTMHEGEEKWVISFLCGKIHLMMKNYSEADYFFIKSQELAFNPSQRLISKVYLKTSNVFDGDIKTAIPFLDSINLSKLPYFQGTKKVGFDLPIYALAYAFYQQNKFNGASRVLIKYDRHSEYAKTHYSPHISFLVALTSTDYSERIFFLQNGIKNYDRVKCPLMFMSKCDAYYYLAEAYSSEYSYSPRLASKVQKIIAKGDAIGDCTGNYDQVKSRIKRQAPPVHVIPKD